MRWPPRWRAKLCPLMAAAIGLWPERGSKTTSSWTSNCGNCWSRATSARRFGVRAIIMEMLIYSRPGMIEVLPALPPSLVKGSINGMLARTFARVDKLAWDMEARTAELTVTSVKKQDVTLVARYGIEAITAPAGSLVAPLQAGKANIDVHLPENKPVTFHIRLGRRNSLDWVN